MPLPADKPPSPLRCGDCHADLPRPAEQPAPPDSDTDTDHYCPQCAVPVTAPLECPNCGSTLCLQCGAILEQADELGIG